MAPKTEGDVTMRLYTSQISSAGRRVEIGLRLKGLDFDCVRVDLAAEKAAPEGAYGRLNPQFKVPSLEDGEHRLTQSLAILEYREEAYPEPALLPADAAGRARIRWLALVVACEVHPLQNTWVVRWLGEQCDVAEAAGAEWQRHWIEAGFEAIEARLRDAPETGRFCHGEAPTLADLFLAPQVWNARRYEIPLESYPTITGVYEACLALPAFSETLS